MSGAKADHKEAANGIVAAWFLSLPLGDITDEHRKNLASSIASLASSARSEGREVGLKEAAALAQMRASGNSKYSQECHGRGTGEASIRYAARADEAEAIERAIRSLISQPDPYPCPKCGAADTTNLATPPDISIGCRKCGWRAVTVVSISQPAKQDGPQDKGE